jgi:nucleotide-binding universal stress UspA family protein
MKTILVATDFSKAASNALAYAAGIARHLKAKLVLFNAFQLPPPMAVSILPRDHRNRYLEENKAQLGQCARQIEQLYGIEVGWQSSYDPLAEALGKQVAQWNVDLVVVGMRGASNTSQLMGNSAIEVLRHARYPVLVVPDEAYFTGIERILFACSYSSLGKHTPLHLLHELAEGFGASVQVLHVEKEDSLLWQEGESAGTRADKALQLETSLGKLRHEYKFVEAGNVQEGIDQGIEDLDADLLVMVSRRSGFWASLLHGSKTCKMAFHTRIPLLALPQSAS